ncbi:conserved exported hypothetical protein [Oceanicaulis sp. 350]|nr:conserved exported hypothetical protein [Oceanicaulis sp. 350]
MTKLCFMTLATASLAAVSLSACASTGAQHSAPLAEAPYTHNHQQADLEADRQAILAMAGEYEVTFDFTEFLPISAGYELADPKVTPAREVVYVIADEGDFISLQHLLLVGDSEDPFVVKHWRQDWAYEPSRLMAYQGFGEWTMDVLSPDQSRGAWSQTVYQVDDSPRYAGIARWEHADEASTWEPARSWRPLPRRDATTRDDYDVIEAVNRHTILSWGWTHEQDNSKIVLRDGQTRELVREHGINTYRRYDLEGDHAAQTYWDGTQGYWADVRAVWDEILETADRFTAEDDAEGSMLYMPVLNEGQALLDGDQDADTAFSHAAEVMEAQITVDGAPLDVE